MKLDAWRRNFDVSRRKFDLRFPTDASSRMEFDSTQMKLDAWQMKFDFPKMKFDPSFRPVRRRG